jgi:hypothetical protein
VISRGWPNNTLSRNSTKSNFLYFLPVFWSQSSRVQKLPISPWQSLEPLLTYSAALSVRSPERPQLSRSGSNPASAAMAMSAAPEVSRPHHPTLASVRPSTETGTVQSALDAPSANTRYRRPIAGAGLLVVAALSYTSSSKGRRALLDGDLKAASSTESGMSPLQRKV